MSFHNLTAVITGGASGIGAAIADAFAAADANVAVLDLDPQGSPHRSWFADVTDDPSVRKAVDAVATEFGGIDILINNAGVGAQGTIENNPDAEWHTVWDLNVVGMVRASRAALPHLRKSTAAAIVNIASIASTAGLPQRALYSATKGAISALTRAMAADHLHEGIRVNGVGPGTADTPWINRLLEKAEDPAAERAALQARQPTGRLVSPQEVAHAVLSLASPLAGAITGVNLPVDGGMQELRLRPRG